MNIQENEKQYQAIAADLRECYRTFKDYQKSRQAIHNRLCAVIRRLTGCGKKVAPIILKKIFGGSEPEPIPYTREEKDRETEKVTKTKEVLTINEQANLHAQYDQLYQTENALNAVELACEKQMGALVKTLPIWDEWACDIGGIDKSMFGQILAEIAYPLSCFENPAKVWTRMCVGLVDHPDGTRHRQRQYTDIALANLHQYNPRRRAVSWNLGACLVRSNHDGYRDLYDSKKHYYGQKCGCLALEERNGSWRQKTCKHCNDMAQRYVAKRFLRDLWRKWTGKGREWTGR